MVSTARRRLATVGSSNDTGDRKGQPPKAGKYRDDIESGYKPSSADVRAKFRDVVGSVIADGRRTKLKQKLLDGIGDVDLESYRKSQDELKQMKNKKLRGYYEQQNEKLNDWIEVDTLVKAISGDIMESFDPQDEDCDGIAERGGALQLNHEDLEPLLPEDERERRRKDHRVAKWAININVVANILLLGAKIVAAIFSSSLSLIASLVDSALDLLCTLIVWSTNKLVERRISRLNKMFPIGRRRLEPIGILVFSVIMIVSFIQILQESGKKLLEHEGETAVLPPTAIFAMVATVVLKGIIGIGCWRIKTTQVQALAQDCKTDVIFNTASLLFPLIGSAANVWWLDPVGAGILSIYIIIDWAHTCLEQVARLSGVNVDDRMLTKLMFLAWRFSPVVDGYKSIKAYHAGDGVWCEVDLILDEKTPLEHAHDVAETLQYCLEGLKEVDRSFVSMDYKIQGPSGHGATNGSG